MKFNIIEKFRKYKKERFIPTNANWNPDDEDLSDKYEDRRFKFRI